MGPRGYCPGLCWRQKYRDLTRARAGIRYRLSVGEEGFPGCSDIVPSSLLPALSLSSSALNSSDIKKLGVDLLPGYYDPFSGRTLTKGEVGCFLSHHYVWKEVWPQG